MSSILDQGTLLFASVAVLLVTLVTPMGVSFYTPLLVLAIVYVPGVLLLSKLVGSLGGGFGSVFQRDYSPLLTCSAMAWTAANIPVLIASRLVPQASVLIPVGVAALYFLVLMFFA